MTTIRHSRLWQSHTVTWLLLLALTGLGFALAKAVTRVIEDPQAPIRLPVGVKAETFVPLIRQLGDEDFETKVREVFGL